MPKQISKELQILKRSPIFQGIEMEDLLKIVSKGQWKRVNKGVNLLQQGENAECVYILVEGKTKLTQLSSEGNQVVLSILGPGQIIGGVAVLENASYPATALATEKCHLFCLNKKSLTGLMSEYPAISMNVVKLLLRRIQELQERFRELATERVEKRMARTILRLAQHQGRKIPQGVLIDVPLTRQDLAEITGTTLFTASRLLKSWEAQGLLGSEKKKLILKKPEELRSLAEQ